MDTTTPGVIALPHFAIANGNDSVALDKAKDACPKVGRHLYVLATPTTLQDQGVPTDSKHQIGITNRLMLVLVGPDANNLASESLPSQEFISPLAQRVLALENRTGTQASQLAKMIGHTQSVLDTEVAKVKTGIDGEM